MSEPSLGTIYPMVHIPQIDVLTEAIMALQDTINTLLATIAEEFQEVKAKLEAAVAAVTDALSRETVAEADRDAAQAALADVTAQMDAADAQLQDAAAQVGRSQKQTPLPPSGRPLSVPDLRALIPSGRAARAHQTKPFRCRGRTMSDAYDKMIRPSTERPPTKVTYEGPSQPTDPQLGDKWHDINSGNTFTWNGEGWVQDGFDPEHPVP